MDIPPAVQTTCEYLFGSESFGILRISDHIFKAYVKREGETTPTLNYLLFVSENGYIEVWIAQHHDTVKF